MADISDVEQALVDIVAEIIYPDGVASGSIFGAACRIYRGWPNSSTLNADLAAGVVNVTVTSDNDSDRVTTRYWGQPDVICTQPALQVSVAANTISISGSSADGLVVGACVDGDTFFYRASGTDSPALIASNLASAIQQARPVIVAGTSVTVVDAYRLAARVVAEATLLHEARRQEKDLRIALWCPSAAVRDAVASAVDAALSGFNFIRVADCTSARITYAGTATYDQSQNAILYRRDLRYTVEYATIIRELVATMLFGGAGLNGHTTYG